MALTNDQELAWKMSMLCSNGVTRDEDRLKQESQGPWYYEQQDLGFNYRMTDIHAALGLSQLTRVKKFVERRNALAKQYDGLLANLPLKRPIILPENSSSYHLYVIRLHTREEPNKHRRFFEELRRAGIGVNLHYMPVHLQPYYRKLGFEEGQFSEAEAHAREAISLPLYPDLTESQQNQVVRVLTDLL